MKLSIVIAVLDSTEVVRRQCLYFKRMPLPDDVELILVDDGSVPPLKDEDYELDRLHILRHDMPAAWTQPAARNLGVRCASGEYVICTDIDHILSEDLIDCVLRTDFDVVKFQREVAVLDENGRLVQTEDAMREYGFEERRLKRTGFSIPAHTNSFAIRRQLYLDLGGVSEHRVGSGKHPNREEIPLRRSLAAMQASGKIRILDADCGSERPLIYMIPNGRYCGEKDFNPFGLFHNLPRKTRVG